MDGKTIFARSLLRKAQARSVDAVSTCIGKFLEAFSHQECTNYSKNAGYDLT